MHDHLLGPLLPLSLNERQEPLFQKKNIKINSQHKHRRLSFTKHFFKNSVDRPMSHYQQHIQRLHGENWQIFRHTLPPTIARPPLWVMECLLCTIAIICSCSKELAGWERKYNQRNSSAHNVTVCARKGAHTPGLIWVRRSDVFEIALLGLHPDFSPLNCINRA